MDAPGFPPIDRQGLVRHLVEQVVATAPNGKDFVDVTIHWAGGHASRHEVSRRVLRFEQLRQYPALRDRMVELREAGWTARQIAEELDRQGFRSPRNRTAFNAANVNALLKRRGHSAFRGHHWTDKAKLKRYEWCLPELARKLNVPIHTMQRWRQRAWVHARRVPGAPNRWLVWADRQELDRLRRLRDCPLDLSHKYGDRYPKELTTPKERPGTPPPVATEPLK